jgi:hypothetical protein
MASGTPSVSDAASVEQVLLTIQAALSNDTATRAAAETLLRAWEADAAPGFLVSLLRIVEQQQTIDGVRFLEEFKIEFPIKDYWDLHGHYCI